MKKIHDAGFLCDFDMDPGTTMNKRIRNAQVAQYNFIFGKSHCLEMVSERAFKAVTHFIFFERINI